MEKAYKSIEIQAQVDAASPHELIHLLIKGAIANLLTAHENISRNQTKEKCVHITKCMNIIDELKASLNIDEGGTVAKNLLDFYQHVQFLLINANKSNDIGLLLQCIKCCRN